MKRFGRSSHNKNGRPANPVRHDFALSLRSLLPVALLALIVFTALIPVSTAAMSGTSVFNINYTHDQLKFRFCADGVIPFVNAAAVLFGAAASLKLFSFMQDRRRSAFYFSLGISRKALYFVRTLACLLVLAAAIVLPMVISLLLNIRALGAYDGVYSYFFAMTAAVLLQAAAGMLIGQAGCFLSGTYGESLLAAVTVAAAPSTAFCTAGELMKTFLWGNVYGASTYAGSQVKSGLLYGLSSWNPVIFSYRVLDRYHSFSRSMEQSRPDAVRPGILLIWLAVLIVCVFLLAWLFNRYRAERSGISGLFTSMNVLISVIWPAAAFAAVLGALRGTGAVVSLMAAILSALLVYAVLAGGITLRAKRLRFRIAGAAGLCLVLLACAGITDTGFFGLYYHLPEASEVKSVRITYAGDPSYIPDSCDITQNGQSVYASGTVRLRSEEAVSEALKLADSMVSLGNTRMGASDDPEKTVYPYDIQFRFTDKNGKTHTRYYDRVRASTLTEFLRLEDTGELMGEMGRTVTGSFSDRLWNSEAFASGEIYVSDPWMTDVRHITLSGDMRTQLLDTVAEDLKTQKAQARYHPDTDSQGFIYFTLNGDSDLSELKSGTAETKVYYDNTFVHVTALLSQWNALPAAAVPSDGRITGVQLQKFDPFGAMNSMDAPLSLFFSEYRTGSDDDFVITQDFGTRPEITDADQIRELAEASVSSSYMDDAGCLAAFQMNDGTYVYRYIPMDKEPEFIKSKIN